MREKGPGPFFTFFAPAGRRRFLKRQEFYKCSVPTALQFGERYVLE